MHCLLNACVLSTIALFKRLGLNLVGDAPLFAKMASWPIKKEINSVAIAIMELGILLR
jgi:hypothetical protein